MTTQVLDRRTLNRTLLERQFLVRRVDAAVEATIEHLVGLQAQAPLAPYVALWSRLRDFGPASLAELIQTRRAVRATAMLRGTIHLFNGADSLQVRPMIQPVLERAFRGSPFARNVAGVDIDALLAKGRETLAAKPLTIVELGRHLAQGWPDRDATSLSYTVRYLVPLVQVPPRGIWGTTGPARVTTLDGWLGSPLGDGGAPDDLVLRYLAAFGPATVADIATWSWLTGLREVVERLRPRLRTYRDESGRELFDLPERTLADPDLPAPVRFLPEYDNLLLSHEDRTRVMPAGWKLPLFPGNGAVMGTFLVDGFVRGTWRIARSGATAELTVAPDTELTATDRRAVEDEGLALLRFIAPEFTAQEVRFGPS